MNSHAYNSQVDRSDRHMIAVGDKNDYRKITRNIATRYKILVSIFVSVFTFANVMSLTHAMSHIYALASLHMHDTVRTQYIVILLDTSVDWKR